MSKSLVVATIGIPSILGDKVGNTDKTISELNSIPKEIDLVVLPEMFSTGIITDDENLARDLSERNTGETITILSQIASEKGFAIAGSFLANTASRLYNRAFFIEPSGDTTFYDKKHLFSMGNETKLYTPGFEIPPVVRFRGWNLALAICYDLRFPLWLRNYQRRYDALILPASWPEARSDAWNTLLKARAIENQAYVIGANRIGTEGKLCYDGAASAIIDFKGKVISKDFKENIKLGIFDYESYTAFLQKFPVWQDADRLFSLDFPSKK